MPVVKQTKKVKRFSLGHSDIRMTERYTHTNKDKKYAAVCLL